MSHAQVQPDRTVGVSPPMPFTHALWGHVSHETHMREHMLHSRLPSGFGAKPAMGKHEPKTKVARGAIVYAPPPVGPSKEVAKHIKMLSMNPSVYGNIYGVLGSS